MKKKLVTLLAFITTALVLVACGGGGIEVTPAIDATQFDDESIVKLSSDKVLVRVKPELHGELVVFEVSSTPVSSIKVYDGLGNKIGASNDPHFFVGPNEFDVLTAGVSSVETMISVTPTSQCYGPCVIAERGSATSSQYFYVEVDADADVDLFAYMAGIGDVAEGNGGNDTSSTAFPLVTDGTEHTGAFETIEDFDWYLVEDFADVIVTKVGPGWDDGLDMIIRVVPPSSSSAGDYFPDPSGSAIQFEVNPDEKIQIGTVNGRAGSFDASKYTIEVKYTGP